jgi:hypothetical protein
MAWGAYPHTVKADFWSFAVLGDQRDEGSYGINQPIVAAMAAQIATQSPVFVLCAGDQIHGIDRAGQAPWSDQYDHWKDAMAPILSISYPVRGNHETYGDVNMGLTKNLFAQVNYNAAVAGATTPPTIPLPDCVGILSPQKDSSLQKFSLEPSSGAKLFFWA